MSNYPIILRTAEEARAWAKAHPDGELISCLGYILRRECLEGNNAPYTVLKTGNTITIHGRVYREGDGANINPEQCKGCVVEVLDHYAHNYDLKILYIPDEVADKPAPKEPKTLTLDEAYIGLQTVYVLDEVEGGVKPLKLELTKDYLDAQLIVQNGGYLYLTEQDAVLGKSKGMK